MEVFSLRAARPFPFKTIGIVYWQPAGAGMELFIGAENYAICEG